MNKMSKKKVYINRKIKNAQSLEVDGQSFRSRLEVYCYQRLKEENIEFEYESTKFCLLPDFKYNNNAYESYKKKGSWYFGEKTNNIKGVTYKPDFVNIKDGWILECKGYPNDSFPLKWKLFKYLLMRNNIKFDLYMPKNQQHIEKCIEQIKSKHGENNSKNK